MSIVKKQRNSLVIKIDKNPINPTKKELVSLLLPGSFILLGFWGMLVEELQFGMLEYMLVLPALICLGMGLFLKWEKKWHAVPFVGMLMLLLVFGFLFQQQLSESIAGLLEKTAKLRLVRRGVYTEPFEMVGSAYPLLSAGSLLSGFVTAFILRSKNIYWKFAMVLVVTVARVFGLVEGSWPFLIYMTGVLLVLAKDASGLGETICLASGIALIAMCLFAGSLWIVGYTPKNIHLGTRLEAALHAIQWEKVNNPLPEGRLKNLDSYKPNKKAVMEVTMEHWTPLYLRGFVAGEYTERGWELLEPRELLEDADVLYALQENHFFASDQIAAGWKAIKKESDNHVSIKVLDACKANTYLPYGAGNVTEGVLDSSLLRKEGAGALKMSSYKANLYSVEDSYLLQGQLAATADSTYLSAESAYRNWVYERYVTIPESEYEVLEKYFSVSGEITTVQAKKKISELLGKMISYRENIMTDTGKRSFSSYVMDVSKEGYSVHYATLATLLLRSTGIPARYVEGYVVTPSQAEVLKDGETLTLTQKNSHAWTEYYLDGVGWIPFDATPGYEDILNYKLPDEGIAAGNAGVKVNPVTKEDLKNALKKTPKVEEETKLSQQIYIREAIFGLLLLLILAMIAFVARILILRHRLRKYQELFYSNDYRKACAAILCYIRKIVSCVGVHTVNPDITEIAEQMSSVLDEGTDVKDVKNMLNEVWFSNHEITVSEQEKAFMWLQHAKQTWTQKVPVWKKLKQRFITCQIL